VVVITANGYALGGPGSILGNVSSFSSPHGLQQTSKRPNGLMVLGVKRPGRDANFRLVPRSANLHSPIRLCGTCLLM
jgi:hypothetical protein